MTTTVVMLNLAMSLPALVVLIAAAVHVLRPGPDPPGEEGRADWRGPFGRHLDGRSCQRTVASIATATNSSAR
jgi:hypothetical protein